MDINKLNCPSWDEIKNLDKNNTYHFTVWASDSIDTQGIITLFEEGNYTESDYMIYFDVWQNGYVDATNLTTHGKFTEKSYQEICGYAKACRNFIIAELLEDKNEE